MTEKQLEADGLPEGFRFAGVACGIKESGKPDLSLIVTDEPATAVGVFTTNQIVAAPVLVCKSHTPSNRFRAVVTNSGNANACTGQPGMANALAMCTQVAEQLGCEREQVLVMSTGVIGHQLPMDAVQRGIHRCSDELSDSLDGFCDSADAILTTDKARKVAHRSVMIGQQQVRVSAMAKGAGMIAPNMATMLAVIMTDASLGIEDAQRLISNAADCSFNQVSVDGHTSTNDTLLLIASGNDQPLSGDGLETLTEVVKELCIELAKELVADGEGATHVMALTVQGARSNQEADTIARVIAASQLVKTAITGGDPNWGRIVSAAGYAPVPVEPNAMSLEICDVVIYENGAPVEFDEKALSEKMKASQEVKIRLLVGSGTGCSKFWSSDLTTDYVSFNSEYTT